MVTTESNVVRYGFTPSVSIYDFAFPFFSRSDIKVIATDSDGKDTVLTAGTDYSVSFPGDSGTITLLGDISGKTWSKLTIIREIAITQTTDLDNGQSMDATTVEASLDRLLMQIQQIAESISRTITSPITEAGQNLSLPPSSQRKSKAIGFSEDGKSIVLYSNPDEALAAAAEANKKSEALLEEANTLKETVLDAQVAAETAQGKAEDAQAAAEKAKADTQQIADDAEAAIGNSDSTGLRGDAIEAIQAALTSALSAIGQNDDEGARGYAIDAIATALASALVSIGRSNDEGARGQAISAITIALANAMASIGQSDTEGARGDAITAISGAESSALTSIGTDNQTGARGEAITALSQALSQALDAIGETDDEGARKAALDSIASALQNALSSVGQTDSEGARGNAIKSIQTALENALASIGQTNVAGARGDAISAIEEAKEEAIDAVQNEAKPFLPIPVLDVELDESSNSVQIGILNNYTGYGNVVFRYSRDSDPTEASPSCTFPLTITSGGIYYFRAYPAVSASSAQNRPSPSRIVDLTEFSAAEPEYSIENNGSSFTITLTCDTAGATIRYTTDNTEPSSTNGLLYTGPITVSEGMTIKAVAMKAGLLQSSTMILLIEQAATPTYSFDDDTQSVTLSTTTTDAIIYYTTDNSDPDDTDNVYSSPIALTEATTIKAIAYKNGLIASDVMTAIIEQAATPTYSFDDDTGLLTFSTTDENAVIRYTTDGTTPDASDTVYSEPIQLSGPASYKIRAFETGKIWSEIAVATIEQVAQPTYTYTNNIKTITLSCTTPDASIYYTLDGSAPTKESNLYSGPFTIPDSLTLKAKAYKENYLASSAISADIVVIKIICVSFPITDNVGTRLTPETDPLGLVTETITTEPVPEIPGIQSGSSPFDQYDPWQKRRCNFENGAFKCWDDDPSFSTTEYDTMVQYPKNTYIKFALSSDGNTEYFYFSTRPFEGFKKAPWAGKYGAVYETSNSNESKSGKTVQVNQSIITMRTNARAKGTGWNLLDAVMHAADQWLFMVEYASRDCQAKIGQGISGASAAHSTGETDVLEYHTGRCAGMDNQCAVRYRWSENLWGNVYEICDGVRTFGSYQKYVTDDPDLYDASSNAGWIPIGAVKNVSSNYILSFEHSTEADWCCFIPAANTTSPTNCAAPDYTSMYYSFLRVSGLWNNDSNCGLWCFDLYGSASSRNVYIGSRLTYREPDAA